MPAIWASSERSLFVRTVWVDGMRHAVLSPDDPAINPRLHRRSRTFVEKNFSAKHEQTETRLERLNSCFMNLHIVVEKNFPDNKIPRIVRRQSAPPCARMCSEKTEGLLEIYVNDIDKLDENCQTLEKEEVTFRSMNETAFNHSSNVDQSMCFQRDTSSPITECKQTDHIDKSSDAHWNPLSERVLQWLDLSGKAQDYELVESKENSKKVEEVRRWSAVRRRRHLSQTRENSFFAGRERIVVQNYKLQKNCKLECVTKATEAKLARKRLSKIKDAMEDKIRKEESIQSKNQVSDEEEDDLKNEDESRDDLSITWCPPARLQLHIVMPSFNSVEKRASSLESLACD